MTVAFRGGVSFAIVFHRVQRIGFDGNLSNYVDPVNGANSPNPVPAKRGLQKWRTVGA